MGRKNQIKQKQTKKDIDGRNSSILHNCVVAWLTLKAPRKMHLKLSSVEVVCCKKCLTLEANGVDPEQTAPIGAV